MTEKKSLALIDFDGTVTTKNSFIDFLQYNFGIAKLMLGFLHFSPSVVLFFLKIIPNWKLKEVALTHFFGGWLETDFLRKCHNYSTERLPNIIRPEAKRRLAWHQKNGHEVAIVSASVREWLKGWCDEYKLGLIATEIEIRNGKVTGRLLGKNCYGSEKVNRIKKEYQLSSYNQVYAYTDSMSDLPMLELADEKYYKWNKIQ